MYQPTAHDAAGSTSLLEPPPARPERRERSAGPPLARPRPRPGRATAAGPSVEGLVGGLAALLRLRGVTYGCVIDAGTGEIAGARGTSPGDGVPLALVAWAGSPDAADADRTEDVVVTTRTAVHLVQRVRPSGGGTTAWLYLHLLRDRGTVAVVRLELAALAGPARPPATAPRTIEDARRAGAPGVAAATASPTAARPAPPEPLGGRLPLPRRPSASLPPPPRRRTPPSEFVRPRGGRGATSGPGRANPLPRSWANDLSTLQRLLTGLRQLA